MGALYGGSFVQNIEESDCDDEDEIKSVNSGGRFKKFVSRKINR